MTKVLIAVDIQNDFVDGALGSAEAAAIVSSAAEKLRTFTGKIFVTMDTHGADYMQTQEGKYLPVPHCIKGTDGWKLNPEIAAALESREYEITEKPSFGSIGLIKKLEPIADGIERIELIGLCTDICVVSNALLIKAAFPEISVAVDSSCCAGTSPEAHNAALMTMRSCQIDVI